MSYTVLLSNQADEDVREIYEYIAFDLQSKQNAIGQINRLEKEFLSLAEIPKRLYFEEDSMDTNTNKNSQAAIQKAASIQKAKNLYAGAIINGIQFLEPTEHSVKGDGILWRCKCIHCSEDLITTRKMARRRKVCACQKLPSVRQEDYTERIGKRYGRLTFLRLAGVDSKNHMLGVFQCECGKIVEKRLESVFHGRTASCGCLLSEQAAINLSNY